MSEDDAAEMLLQQRVEGMIFVAALRDSVTIGRLSQRGIPIVLSNRVVEQACDTVESDNAGGGAMVVDYLAELGHRRIGMLEGNPRASTSIERAKGYKRGLRHNALAFSPELRMIGDFSYAPAYQAALALLDLPDRPTAIFCHSDLMAFAAINAALSRGLDVPSDLSVVGFDNVRQSSWEVLNLTTVSQPLEEMANSAVDLLLERIANPTLPPRVRTYPCRLIVRGTAVPPTTKGRK
jgi:LacI family transcriptional regulator